jgi:hypothetical protein
MPLPLIRFVIGLGATVLAARKAHDALADHSDLGGFCSNCGNVCSHEFHQSGMTWRRMGAVAVLLGAAGLGVSSLMVRNIYRCRGCRHLVLQCRTPGCPGMALSGNVYDDEFCGECYRGNDKSQFHKAVQDRQQKEQLVRVLRAKQKEQDALEARVQQLEADRSADKKLIAQLVERLSRIQRETHMMTRALAA